MGARFKRDGTSYTPPGAKTAIKGDSATSVKRAMDTLRRVMDIAVERGAIHANPVSIKPAEGSLQKKIVRTHWSAERGQRATAFRGDGKQRSRRRLGDPRPPTSEIRANY
jgi:hypothetical protein